MLNFMQIKLLIPGDVIELDFGIDGVVIHANSNIDSWPILFRITQSKEVFTYGIYSGPGKPKNSDSLVRYFVNDFQQLCVCGFMFNNRKIKVHSRAFVCDGPGKALVLETKYPNGMLGCLKCRVQGRSINRRMVFADCYAAQRTNEDFRARSDPLHHRNLESLIIEQLEIDIAQDFVADSMHAVHLGVSKLTLKTSIETKGKPYTFSKATIESINNFLKNVKWASEFNRKLRPLDFLHKYKATECKNWLMYAGIVILENEVNDLYYEHFRKLFIAIRILSDKEMVSANIDLARDLIIDYINDFGDLYENFLVGYNVHNLLHLPDDCEYFDSDLGALNAYSFENENMSFKRMVKTGNNTLQQIGNRISEKLSLRENAKVIKDEIVYPNISYMPGLKIYRVNFQNFSVCTKEEESFCLVGDKIFQILQILNDETILVKGNFLKNLEPVFTAPIDSRKMNLYKCRKLVYEAKNPVIISAKEIKCKFQFFQHNNFYIFIKIIA